ncbi:deoxyguanosinetriphosphate triphosphohydrolase [Yersinia enterocolitica]|uniref:anti-phage deoxyguanosine triphosphatase n=1 Tax=Yersinia enterocolitica TaxID=630 RepID=UPI0005DD0405|nr:anti-phage deoxyguanosine triphosphatase [Yersinia enterocolitica]ELI8284199.1 deoxyguanosinetriphosphate triphosphohydrolase family protein [Yersinia enterocolitica]MCE3129834.1 deoxyguanosinetriphosphate triphosphohydrolase family protein [Yersinia enterocolitica]CFQ14853.1 deoxyguanosinetriphosphate triphosphohydrolase [Yersinia enterocolitica]CNF49693.1 deoxyguanosinetriphosphate triphosphohydrolase [Yersinia enterocolitica]CNF71185.1 deoxyguanosinetriphosphate triphosphohydrolase [Yers
MDLNYWNRRKRNDDEGYPVKEFNSNTDDSQFQRDRARIIHSAAFRRLQTKTQVLGLGENDFYRTRLTHSLEVAQIGSAICERLHDKYKDHQNIKKWIPSLSLIEAIGLSHDIGHPPFGHGGEVALNYSMITSGGFEGNGQTLRIVSRLAEYSPHHGMDLTRRTLLGLIKYPAPYSKVKNYKNKEIHSDKTPLNLDNWQPPKCYLDDENDIINWIFKGIPETDTNLFNSISMKDDKHHKTLFKSFDTTIMELADDISYGVHDLEDGIALGLINKSMWEKDVIPKILEKNKSEIAVHMDFYNEKLFLGTNKERKHAISKLVGYFISSIFIREDNKFNTPLLRLNARLEDDSEAILKVLKEFVMDRVIQTPEVQVLEYKGQQIVLKIFEVLRENPNRLLPKNTLTLYKISRNKDRVLCDYISGMTDNYATKLYHKLFTPDIGSIFDRL